LSKCGRAGGGATAVARWVGEPGAVPIPALLYSSLDPRTICIPVSNFIEPAALLIKMCCVLQRLEGNNILKHIVLLPASQRAKQNLVFIRLAHN